MAVLNRVCCTLLAVDSPLITSIVSTNHVVASDSSAGSVSLITGWVGHSPATNADVRSPSRAVLHASLRRGGRIRASGSSAVGKCQWNVGCDKGKRSRRNVVFLTTSVETMGLEPTTPCLQTWPRRTRTDDMARMTWSVARMALA